MTISMYCDSLYIGGKKIKPITGAVQTVINPATEEVIGEAPVGTIADAEAAISAAREAFDKGPWPKMEWRERAKILQKFHDALIARKTEIVNLIVAEAGSTVAVASAMHFDMSMDGFQYFIEQMQRREFIVPGSVSVHPSWTGGQNLGSTVKVYEPLGVSVGITAYNYPFFLNIAKIGPALAAGAPCFFSAGIPGCSCHTGLFLLLLDACCCSQYQRACSCCCWTPASALGTATGNRPSLPQRS